MADQPGTPYEPDRPRRRWLAALASFFLPGLGQLYAGKPRRAAGWFAIQLLLTTALASTYVLPLSRGLMLVIPALTLLGLACIIDAWRQAARQRNYHLKSYNRWWIYLGLIVGVNLILYPLGGSGAVLATSQSYYVPAASMTPAITVGDYLMADTYPPRLVEIRRGDVILFIHEGTVFVKRVIGVPGDRIALTNDTLSINGQVLPQQVEPDLATAAITGNALRDASLFRETWPDGRQVLILKKPTGNAYSSFSELTVPAGSFFVMGDSRDNSVDSRMFGSVPHDQIVGRASFIWWSRNFSRAGRLVN